MERQELLSGGLMQKGIKVVFEVNKRMERVDRDRLIHCIGDLEWQAVLELMLEHIESVTQYLTDEGIAKEHGSLAYYSGGLAALRLLFAQMKDTHDKNVELV
jgi:hypothetical protein